MYIHEQVTDQIFSHEAFTFSIVVIYILGGFNVFGVMYINLNPKVLAAAPGDLINSRKHILG